MLEMRHRRCRAASAEGSRRRRRCGSWGGGVPLPSRVGCPEIFSDIDTVMLSRTLCSRPRPRPRTCDARPRPRPRLYLPILAFPNLNIGRQISRQMRIENVGQNLHAATDYPIGVIVSITSAFFTRNRISSGTVLLRSSRSPMLIECGPMHSNTWRSPLYRLVLYL